MDRHTSFVERVAAFTSGLAAVACLQAGYGWWLNSGSGVVRTGLVLLVLSFVGTWWRESRPWDRALAIWLGAISGSTGALFWIGPGTIWPIALGMAAVITAGAVMAGTLLGTLMRARR